MFILSLYTKDAEPKVTINKKKRIYIYLNIFEGGSGQKHETELL
jgi:hypothetical protein